MNAPQKVYGSVILAGSDLGLSEVRRELRGDYPCHHYRNNAMLVKDVVEEDLPHLERLADSYGVWVDQVQGVREVVAAEEKKEEEESLPEVDVAPGYWYKINQDAYPLLHVISIRSERGDEGKIWLYECDLVGPGAMPMPMTFNSETLKKYKPKPASLEDFEELDIIPPYGFDGVPHVIPEPEEKKED